MLQGGVFIVSIPLCRLALQINDQARSFAAAEIARFGMVLHRSWQPWQC